ncbi:MAG TPA: 4-(cytidine 5'-diphospho)-2-C-methyl-D-erythritol kinase [Longimicrobiaceae bacterium]|nr:4-(cytidine 5'-diphospho)-2-C-methyl-D-erythritol kinase [Longimicrobiaceae bacterium]
MSEPDTISLLAPAKVNLRLRILSREDSGFHNLETIFCAVSLADTIRIVRGAPGIELLVDGAVETGPTEQNLVMKAARRFYQEFGQPAEIRIELTKRIPSGAGLGGGSSDAATTLLALNALHDRPFTAEELLQWGSDLGSDVPFFLCSSPLALAWGRGERLLSLPPLPARHVLIAYPGAPLSTRDAFARFAESRGDGYPALAGAMPLSRLSSWDGIAGLAVNDFELFAMERIPKLRYAHAAMRRAGAFVALLAGSGSSMFGIFNSADQRQVAAWEIEEMGLQVWSADTLSGEPKPG